MGRQANALDWTAEGSGVLRVIADSEIRIRGRAPIDEGAFEDDEPTRPLARPFLRAACDPEPLSARGIARLSALADWMAGEESSGVVVGLVRAFLGGLDDVRVSLSALLAAGDDPSVPPGLYAAVQSLALAVGLWRSNLVDHVDDLALSDHRSLSGWSSLPEYSCAYTLAFLQPALSDAKAWAIAKRGESGGMAPLVDALGASIRGLNATLRTAIEGAPEHACAPGGVLAAVAW